MSFTLNFCRKKFSLIFMEGGEDATTINQDVANMIGSSRKVKNYRDRGAGTNRVMGEINGAQISAVDTKDKASESDSSTLNYLFIASNDGFFYIFESQELGNGTKHHKLAFSYLPVAMERQGSTVAKQWVKLAEKGYGTARPDYDA